MTDERLGDGVADALCRLPRGSGVVLRHYALAPAARRALAVEMGLLCKRRGLLLVVADPPPGLRVQAVHLPARARRRPRGAPAMVTAAVHDMREAARAVRLGAGLLFVSPVFPTASHPGGTGMGPVRFGLLVQRLKRPVIALGGMTAARARQLRPLGAAGFAAIDGWGSGFCRQPPPRQKASAPPR